MSFGGRNVAANVAAAVPLATLRPEKTVIGPCGSSSVSHYVTCPAGRAAIEASATKSFSFAFVNVSPSTTT